MPQRNQTGQRIYFGSKYGEIRPETLQHFKGFKSAFFSDVHHFWDVGG